MPEFDSVAMGREIAGPCSYPYTDCFCYPNRTRCDNCERTRNFTVAINKIERAAHTRERGEIAQFADAEAGERERFASSMPEGEDGASAAWSAHATMVDFADAIRARSDGPTALLIKARRDRLRDAADALERATAVDTDGKTKPDDAPDDPEGTFVVKMTETIRGNLVKLLREAASV